MLQSCEGTVLRDVHLNGGPPNQPSALVPAQARWQGAQGGDPAGPP
jgi:hypothetical protein